MSKLNTFIDICAGIGGFRLALEKHGLECIYTSEIDQDCATVYNENFKDNIKPSDITKIDPEKLPQADVICAGFPCQPFSIAGKRNGLQDPRANVLLHIIQAIKNRQPKVFILENVENFEKFDGGNVFSETVKELTQSGYNVFSQILDASRFGVPQQRKRLFIVGFSNNLKITAFTFPSGSSHQTSFRPFIHHGDDTIPISDRWKQYIEYYAGRLPLQKLTFIPPKTRIALERKDAGIDLDDCVMQIRSSGIRAVSVDKPLPTFAVSVSGGGAMIPVYTAEKRHLNLVEMRRIMGFPDSFSFKVSRTSAVKQLANAVAPPVVQALFTTIEQVIYHSTKATDLQYLPA